MAEFVTGERDVNARVRGLEDAARLAMGSFVIEEPPPPAPPSVLRIAMIAGGAALTAVLAFAVLQ